MTTLYHNLKCDGAPAVTQLSYPFNSYCRFNGHILAAGDGGLFHLRQKDFNGSNIEASFTTFENKLGYDGNKRLRFLYLGIETEGKIKITVTVDGQDSSEKIVEPNATGQQFIKIPFGRSLAGHYWGFKVENIDGCWFAIEQLSVLPINLATGRRTTRG